MQQLHGGHGPDHGNQIKAKGSPLMIQGFRSNPKDPESHILFFDIEALIGMSLQYIISPLEKLNLFITLIEFLYIILSIILFSHCIIFHFSI